MTNVNKSKFESIEIIIPNKVLTNNFHTKVKDNFSKILRLYNQISLLTEARDRLLPKLMSGEIEI